MSVCALQVNVLYLQVPDDMVGGQLHLWDVDKVSMGEPHEVAPKNNTNVKFRGDAYHEIAAFNTNSKQPR